MTALGGIGFLIGLLAWRFAFVNRTRARVGVFMALYVFHLACTAAFFIYAQTNVSDSRSYYLDEGNFASEGFGLATQLIFWSVQGLKGMVGGTYLDYCLLFQGFGFYGTVLLMRSFEEVYETLGVEQPAWTYLLLFLPGLHFWTCTVGKDGAVMMGVCLALWASLDIRKRFVWLSFGLLIVLAIRPHIAIVSGAAVAATLLFDRTISPRIRVLLLFAAVAAVAVAVVTTRSAFQIDVTSADSVSDFFAAHEAATQYETGNTAVTGNFFVKLFSLLFRPLFLDTGGAMGYGASFENLALMAVVAFPLIRFRTTVAAAKAVPFVRFACFHALMVAVMLTLVYYNVGLGLRQKVMFVPALLLLAVAVAAVRTASARVAVAAAAAARGSGGAQMVSA